MKGINDSERCLIWWTIDVNSIHAFMFAILFRDLYSYWYSYGQYQMQINLSANRLSLHLVMTWSLGCVFKAVHTHGLSFYTHNWNQSLSLPCTPSVFALLLTPILGFYDSGDNVVELKESNFDRVLSDDGVWLVEFYAPWCGHCQSLASDWKRVASALKGVVKVAAVNADVEKSLGATYQIRGFPTIYIFAGDKKNPKQYQGDFEYVVF